MAAERGHYEILQMLIELFKVNCSVSSKSGMTPVHHAASKGHALAVQVLLKNGASAVAQTAGTFIPSIT